MLNLFCCNPFKGKKRRKKAEQGDETWRVKVAVVGDGQCGKTCLIQQYCSGTLPETYTPTLFDTSTVTATVQEREAHMVIQDMAGREDLDRLRPPFYLHTDVVIICFAIDNPESWVNVQSVWVPEVRRYCGKVPILLVANKTDLLHNTAGRQTSDHPCTSSEWVHSADSFKAASSFNSKGYNGSPPSSPPSKHHDSTDDEKMSAPEKRSLLADHPRKVKKSTGGRTGGADKKRWRGRLHYDSTLAIGQSLASRIGAVSYLETSALLNRATAEVFQSALTAAVSSKQWRKRYKS